MSPLAVPAVWPRPTGVSQARGYFTERSLLVDCGLAQVSLDALCIGYTGMCHWKGYGFQAIWSGIGSSNRKLV